MNALMNLPKKDEVLADVLRSAIQESSVKRLHYKAKWALTLMYLQGIRDFGTINYVTGNVGMTNLPAEYDSLPFKYEGLLPKFQTELGRLLQIDIAPVVKRFGIGLESLKKASVAQVVLDDLMPMDRQNRLKNEMCKILCQLGFCGVLTVVDEDGQPKPEIVPPWEVSSIPTSPISDDQLSGIVRTRYVSESWLKANMTFGKGKTPNWDNSKFEWVKTQKGSDPNTSGNSSGLGTLRGSNYGSTSTSTEWEERWTEFNEVWVRSVDNKLLQYIAMAGSMILDKTDFTETKPPMPINIAKYLDAGDFYGRGLVEQLIPLNTEIEYMMANLFENVEDFDLYGVTLVSSQMGLTTRKLNDAKKDKFMIYTPDMMNPKAAPTSLQPTNSSTLPSNVAKMALDMMGMQASQSELFSGGAPGRVDNARGLNFLYETANIPLSGPSESIAKCMVGVYQSLIWLAKNSPTTQERLVGLTFDDDVLVGIKFDVASGLVKIDKDSIPNPNEVLVSIGSKTPKSDAQTKMDLDQNLQMGIITPTEYRIIARVSGLDLPLGNEREFQSYRKAKMENISLFGDGETPGQVIVSDYDFHELHIQVLEIFMSRPEFALASVEVQEKFIAHLAEHKKAMGGYPDGMPYPEEDMAQGMLSAEQQELAAMQEEQQYRL